MKQLGFQFNNSYFNLPDKLYTKVTPKFFSEPKMVILNQDLATEMGLDFSSLNNKNLANLFVGNDLPEGSEPFAQAYAGHQYGYFSILGDGRAHIWGEHLTPEGKRLDIQFKGSGRTPYSRRGDGRAALAPMLREYIISEAMYALGIKTTRSLAVVTTGNHIFREEKLPGAILTRVAISHIRIGTFEFVANLDDRSILKTFFDYVVERHPPEIEHKNKVISFLQYVMERQIDLIIDWMRVGFIHGVMNTDNMLISGETIDFGPCAFMDEYDPNTVFSSIDEMGRYAYANQPIITQWNLSRLAETLLPLIDDDRHQAINLANETISQFPGLYQDKWVKMMSAKLGFLSNKDGDEELISTLLDWMQKNHADYTNTFLELSYKEKPSELYRKNIEFMQWYQRWQNRLNQDNDSLESALLLMRENNPAVIPRNHIVETSLQAANKGNLKPFYELLAALKSPYQNRESLKPYQSLPTPDERVYQTFCGT